MKILVTGGCGFIGSNFLEYMIKKYPDYQFVCLDSLTYAGNTYNISEFKDNPNFTFIKGDITDKNLVEEIFSKYHFNIVVNFAAESHVDNSISNPSLFLKTNIIGTQVLMDACLKYKVERFHQISTDEVYGDLPLDAPDLQFYEDSMLKPSNPYSVSKASADLLVLAYVRTYNLNATISRCSNNYGPHQYIEKLIPMTISRSLSQQKVIVHGDGSSIRDWIYVIDHVKAIDLIIHKGKKGQIYNVGGHIQKTNLEVVHQVLDYLNISKDNILNVEDRKGQDKRYDMNTSKIEAELGWRLSFNFDEELKNTIEWYKNNPEFLKKKKSG